MQGIRPVFALLTPRLNLEVAVAFAVNAEVQVVPTGLSDFVDASEPALVDDCVDDPPFNGQTPFNTTKPIDF